MVRLAVQRTTKWGWFRGHSDLSDDSLFADAWGSLVKAKYDSSLAQPHTFAYNVSIRRLGDIRRARVIRIRSLQHDPDVTDERAVELENPAEELPERARQIYQHLIATDQAMFPPKAGPGRPTPTWAQKVALSMLKAEMRWSCRNTADMLAMYPDILTVMGVSKPRSYSSVSRDSSAVAKFAKKKKRLLILSGAIPAV